MLAAWSEPGDPDAEKRLLKLRNLIRIKAGPNGREGAVVIVDEKVAVTTCVTTVEERWPRREPSARFLYH
ncbi:hypothetical protein [Caballeronia mineralivorans]|jgi:hypothetical protein|nr:hypothetical protein [Caballeronia mineralivorans]MDB5782290.1 hypothetical protein [Caballeronia mineralivorans]MEA3105119.1 hypothetical protein [Caballeronia mineralivorans]